MENSVHTYDEYKNLTKNIFTKVGHSFKGIWTTNADGTGQTFSDEQSVINLASEETIVELYAQWNANQYTVTFDPNGGTCTTNSKKVTYGSNYGTLPTPTREGYNFQYWYISGNGGTETKVDSSTTVTYAGDHTLTAKWTPIKYTIKFYANTGTGTMADLICEYGKEYNLSSNAFTKTGYKFVKWNTNENGTGSEYTNKQIIKNLTNVDGAIINLYAQWSANMYTVTFNPNGGSTSQTSKQVIYDTKYGELPTATKKGYIFQGWYLNSQKIESSTIVTTSANHTLTAKWTAIQYYIVYNKNGATAGSTVTSTHTYDVAKNLTSNGYTKAGYKFKGWNTNASGTGTTYADKQSVKNLSATNNDTINLYAQWERNLFTITYNLNGGSWSITNSYEAEFNSTFTIASESPTKSGYYFKGWSTSSSASSVQYKSGSSFHVTGDIALYAVYGSSAVSYVSLDPSSARWVGRGSTIYIRANVVMVDNEVPPPPVYWSDSSTGSNISYSYSTDSGVYNSIYGSSAGSVTLTASAGGKSAKVTVYVANLKTASDRTDMPHSCCYTYETGNLCHTMSSFPTDTLVLCTDRAWVKCYTCGGSDKHWYILNYATFSNSSYKMNGSSYGFERCTPSGNYYCTYHDWFYLCPDCSCQWSFL